MTEYPKITREKLPRNSKAWKNRVKEVFERDGYQCQDCFRFLPFEYLSPCHIKSVGAGGGDEANNLKTKCKFCHDKEHRAIK